MSEQLVLDPVALEQVALNIRKRILNMSYSAKSAHVGSALSCVEILTVLFYARHRQNVAIDKILLSKGHAAMALYATAAEFGLLSEDHLAVYLQDGTDLWGHPSYNEKFPFIEWSTGSLGHGLPVATGFAYAKTLAATTTVDYPRVNVVVSDGECDEGSVWEAALFAGHHTLSHLTAIVDYNKIQSFGRCEEVLNLEPFAQKWLSFGWHVEEVDGHDVSRLHHLLTQPNHTRKPLCLLAHTVKGKGVKELENTVSSHYKPITQEQIKAFGDEK